MYRAVGCYRVVQFRLGIVLCVVSCHVWYVLCGVMCGVVWCGVVWCGVGFVNWSMEWCGVVICVVSVPRVYCGVL